MQISLTGRARERALCLCKVVQLFMSHNTR